MSALTFEPLRVKGRSSLTCDSCAPTSERGALRIARFKATILGHPLGLYCGPCKLRAQEVWDGALDEDLEAMDVLAVEQAA